MRRNRTAFLALACALFALVSLTPPVGAEGSYGFPLGEFEITVVSDGNLVVPTDAIGTDVDRAEVAALLMHYYLDPNSTYAHTNHVLIDTGEARVLVDVGSGQRFQPSAGRLLDNLEAAGIEPDSITHVLLTHAHPDHLWGLMDDFGDAPRFPAAKISISAEEFDWWTAEGRIDEVPETLQGFVVGARNALLPMADNLRLIEGETEIVPGIRMIPTPGHTAGHMSVLVESGGERLLVTGDALTHAYVSFEHPEWQYGRDFDPVQSVATRQRLLEMAADSGMTVIGYHLPFPGIGHVAREDGSFRFVPEIWRWRD